MAALSLNSLSLSPAHSLILFHSHAYYCLRHENTILVQWSIAFDKSCEPRTTNAWSGELKWIDVVIGSNYGILSVSVSEYFFPPFLFGREFLSLGRSSRISISCFLLVFYLNDESNSIIEPAPFYFYDSVRVTGNQRLLPFFLIKYSNVQRTSHIPT